MEALQLLAHDILSTCTMEQARQATQTTRDNKSDADTSKRSGHVQNRADQIKPSTGIEGGGVHEFGDEQLDRDRGKGLGRGGTEAGDTGDLKRPALVAGASGAQGSGREKVGDLGPAGVEGSST